MERSTSGLVMAPVVWYAGKRETEGLGRGMEVVIRPGVEMWSFGGITSLKWNVAAAVDWLVVLLSSLPLTFIEFSIVVVVEGSTAAGVKYSLISNMIELSVSGRRKTSWWSGTCRRSLASIMLLGRSTFMAPP